MSSRSSRTLYVGNLPGDVREREVEDLFYKYGPIRNIDLKILPRPPSYAFVEVELAHGGRGHSSSFDRPRSYNGGGARGGVSRHSNYRVRVTGLPSSASWQDLKIRKLDDSEFRNAFSRAYIRVKEHDRKRSLSRSPSRSRSHSRSRSRDRSKSPKSKSARRSLSRSRSRSISSRSRSGSRGRSLSGSRSRSRSPVTPPPSKRMSRSPRKPSPTRSNSASR
ncbi:uncharacterized protein A4U43_C08F31710 [Asparagus officinalis]|nr:uncharacterized protein A4U43_C08F31710 [Asparagus officinalis]